MYLIYQYNKINKTKITFLPFNQVTIIIRVHTEDNKLVIITETKTVHFDLSEDVDNNLKYEIDFIIKDN